MRIRSSKPNHRGDYSQKRKIQKSRNHKHEIKIIERLTKKFKMCTISKCKYRVLL